jgi:thiol-disulfide isomerase/thioredoxin
MKKLIYAAVAIALMVSCTMQPKYKIEGNIAGLNSGSAVLQKVVDKKLVTVDSVVVEEGAFTFNGTVEQAEYFVITFADTLDGIQLFLDNAEITIEANVESIRDAVVTGSELTTLFNSFNEEIATYGMQMQALYQEYMQINMPGGSGDAARLKEIEVEYMAVENQQKEYIDTFLVENSNNLISPFVALNYGNAKYKNLEELGVLVGMFGEELADSKYLAEINERITSLKNVAVGMKYTDFTMNDIDGNPVSLSSVAEGKYVLIDFWAGWCGPCRQENPFLVASYAKYKDSGFEIFGVSLDDSKEKWTQAIEDDGITWPQVSELNKWDSSARDIYVFNSIPHNMLIDKDGIIIAKDLRGEELAAKLAELFE